jgi:hypothetical protein
MLSYSTKGSADNTSSERVRLAADEVRRLDADLSVDGELQFDAAVSDRVAAIKAPGSAVGGRANVFVFPNLDAGNMVAKELTFIAHAEAAGIVLDNDATGAQTEKHQKRMMGEIAKLTAGSNGALDEADYERTVATLLGGGSDPVISKAPEGAWTHQITDKALQ